MPRETLGPVAAGVLRRINEARAEHLRRQGTDLLWADLGRAMAWVQGTTSNVKLGKRPVDLEELPALAGVLGVRQAWLAFGEGEMIAAATATPTPGILLEAAEGRDRRVVPAPEDAPRRRRASGADEPAVPSDASGRGASRGATRRGTSQR